MGPAAGLPGNALNQYAGSAQHADQWLTQRLVEGQMRTQRLYPLGEAMQHEPEPNPVLLLLDKR